MASCNILRLIFPDNDTKKLDKLCFFLARKICQNEFVLRIWPHIPKKSIIETFIFSAMQLGLNKLPFINQCTNYLPIIICKVCQMILVKFFHMMKAILILIKLKKNALIKHSGYYFVSL